MAENKRIDPFMAISTAVIALAALGITLYKVPLKTLRPAAELREPAEAQKVRSRLWQDPFTTVLENIQSQSTKPDSLQINPPLCPLVRSHGKLCISESAKIKHDPLIRVEEVTNNNKKINVLGVMVPGGPYAEDIELRVRQRVAVLYALFRLGYTPEDAEFLNFIQIQAGDKPCSGPILLSDILPYEWLEKRKDGFPSDKILLLWLNDDIFQRHPLANLSCLIEYLKKDDLLFCQYDKLQWLPTFDKHLLYKSKDYTFQRHPLSDLNYLIKYLKETNLTHQYNKTELSFTVDKPLLYWSQNNTFQLNLLFNLNCLIEYLQKADLLPPLKKYQPLLNFTIIGPPQSVTLLRMIGEIIDEHSQDQLKFPDGFKLFSPAATVSNVQLLTSQEIPIDKFLEKNDQEKLQNHIKSNCKNEETNKFFEFVTGNKSGKQIDKNEKTIDQHFGVVVQKLFKSRNITFCRTIATDEELAEKLVNELINRHLFEEGKAHLVLIAEWDTFYGRSLPKSFRQVMCENVDQFCNDRVYVYSYLRGLDGVAHGVKDSKGQRRQSSDSKDDKDKDKDKLFLEEPVGPAQYDYLRRLADEIYQRHLKLKKSGEGSIRAVGILGTDFYDKYLILQALKQQLPEAIYFTTSLDARYQHELYNKETRNLVVASGFDLKEPDHKKNQPQGRSFRKDNPLYMSIPPFRDSYQTSIFCTIQKAFVEDQEPSSSRDQTSQQTLAQSKEKDYLDPKIFEIGRLSAINLNEKFDIHWSWQKRILMMFALILAFFSFFMWIMCPSLRAWFNKRYDWVSFVIELLLAVNGVCILGKLIFTILNDCNEEPLRFFEGVSMWPTEIIRLLAIICSWFFIFQAQKSLKESDDFIEEKFLLNAKKSKSCEWLKNFFHQKTKQEGEKFCVEYLWERYQNQRSCQWWRIILITIIFFILFINFLRYHGYPYIAVRGTWSYKLHLYTLFSTVISYLVMTLYVLDTTLLLRWFLVSTEWKRPVWKNPESVTAFFRVSELKTEEDGPITKINTPGQGEDLDNWLFIHLVARRTAVVNRLVYYPMFIWLLLFVSIQPYFKNWPLTTEILVIFGVSALLSWFGALMLNRAAERWRAKVMKRLYQELNRLQSITPPDKDREDRVQTIIEEVSNLREGAFLPFYKHPVVQAFLVPFTGVGGLTLLDYFIKLP